MNRIPGLDGLRAVSILFVLSGHLVGNPFGDLANLGVRVFFVISGYLITLLLIREEGKTGTVSLRQFYARRALRIFPASYSLVLVVTAAYILGVIDLHRGDLLHAYTYTMNYSVDRSWWLGHLWCRHDCHGMHPCRLQRRSYPSALVPKDHRFASVLLGPTCRPYIEP
jgi:peptidoglycan/LPS O-acetylase OafA/YrhL